VTTSSNMPTSPWIKKLTLMCNVQHLGGGRVLL
jgi:hypothetical protein